MHAQLQLDLPVRMGLATGEAKAERTDYFGPPLNRAARVMGAGHGGQILVASSTAELVEGIELIDLGSRRLRDLSEALQIYQVSAEGLGSKFPPLKTVIPYRETSRYPRPASRSATPKSPNLQRSSDSVGS